MLTMSQTFKGFTMKKFSQRLRNIFSGIFTHLVISNYDEYLLGQRSKRALVSYLPLPLLPPKFMREQTMFSNKGIAQEIPRALNELGYIVDIIDYRNTTWTPKQNYDLFIGHCAYNFELLSSYLKPNTPRILFATGLYWKEQNYRVAKRLYQVEQKYGYRFTPERIAGSNEEQAVQMASGIICLGNSFAANSFPQTKKVISINNAAFPLHYNFSNDYQAGLKNFLFMAGRGNIHKGLDLLLEAFKDSENHLYICQHIQNDFQKLYSDIFKMPNIHLIGFTKMRSPKMREIMKKCNWIIMPTCAEGQPGSVLEGMMHGLIPIVPDTANITIGTLGIHIKNLDVESVKESINEANSWSVTKCQITSQSILNLMDTNYSPEFFRTNFRQAILSIGNL